MYVQGMLHQEFSALAANGGRSRPVGRCCLHWQGAFLREPRAADETCARRTQGCLLLGFKKAQAEIDRVANESLRSYKNKLFLAAGRLALGLASSFERMSDTQRKEAAEALDWWSGQQAAIVRDPGHIPPTVAPMALLPS